ncbi:3-oxoacyl-[acyl-carrier-protein] reductase [Caballeronia hypogeia]|uniref:3-oxoacyl-[acyl-carrier-protein] reductase n=1 Tax=Caballeronia hypogeia TaxID=1777140 RepID=A0A158C054_9BURK|nr:SDR family oxidoreductase [Caballeronia hypogeia]SAK75610.1 3-oxoacyl-[acyl-carrier-protein] reductase [Caballeronia hypogeia]
MGKNQEVIVVTGGASGIGEACARRFAHAGYRVVLADVNSDGGNRVASELRDAGHDAQFHHVDLASEESVARFASQVIEESGAPVGLINAGGILQNAVRVLDMDLAEFDRLFQINVRGTLIASRAFGAAMCEAGHGSVINLCSMTTFRSSAQVAYTVGKSGLKALTETMAAEWGPRGVRVNAVAPGYTLTQAMQARIDSGQRDPALVIERSALRRFVKPSEVADAVFFLCSSEAAAITGVTLPIDCGWLASTAYLAFASQPD